MKAKLLKKLRKNHMFRLVNIELCGRTLMRKEVRWMDKKDMEIHYSREGYFPYSCLGAVSAFHKFMWDIGYYSLVRKNKLKREKRHRKTLARKEFLTTN